MLFKDVYSFFECHNATMVFEITPSMADLLHQSNEVITHV